MGPVRAAAHVARRGPTETWFDQSAATHAVLEAAYNFWGPWSVTAKGWRALHFEGTRAGWIPYTDVMIGIAAEMNLAVD